MLKETSEMLDAKGFKVSPSLGQLGDYVYERAFVEKVRLGLYRYKSSLVIAIYSLRIYRGLVTIFIQQYQFRSQNVPHQRTLQPSHTWLAA